ncbi:MAG TPA: MerR family transcriptional regulator [Alphaproteobacteria bacterium]|nr:MerR family transcriptional regulator [Alphaproteobacteria bacterium]
MSDLPGPWPSEPRPPRSGKSTAAFRTISEVSEELDVPQHVLRFWETKFAQVKPMKRAGGRRYYRPEDVALLRNIRDLLYRDGFTIRGAQKHLREGGARGVAAAAVQAGRDGALASEYGHARALARGTVSRGEAETTASAARPEPLKPLMPAAPPPAVAASAPVDRAALKAVLEELETLRQLVRARLG